MFPAQSYLVSKHNKEKAKEYESTTTSYLNTSKQTRNLTYETRKSLETNDALTEHLRVITKKPYETLNIRR